MQGFRGGNVVDAETISGITGSISVACWVVVFSPQIIENFRRNSAEGLSLSFLVIWLTGDVFNVFGGLLQGVLPTMIILALYYTLADIILIVQVLYYRRKQRRAEEEAAAAERRGGWYEQGPHLSPATPLLSDEDIARQPPPASWSMLKSILVNSMCVLLVVAAGIAGYLVSPRPSTSPRDHRDDIYFDFWGQVLGYLCAAFYLGSRIPQLLLNYRRKTCEGLSLLFFLFSCLGNVTYVFSILAAALATGEEYRHHHTLIDWAIVWRYLAVNLSWIIGSAGTLALDGIIFAQFFMYTTDEDDEDDN